MTSKEITEFYNKYRQRLYNTAFRITADSFDAEEIMQNTIIKYLKNERHGELSQEQIWAWLHKTCTRGAIDSLRARNALNRKLEELASIQADAYLSEDDDGVGQQVKDRYGTAGILLEDNMSAAEKVNLIRRRILKLPDGYRIILTLILFEGYDYEEVAQILGIAQVTVRSQYLRGKNKLLEIIRNDG